MPISMTLRKTLGFCRPERSDASPQPPPNVPSCSAMEDDINALQLCISEMISNPFAIIMQDRILHTLKSYQPENRLDILCDLLKQHADNEWLLSQKAIACTDSKQHNSACEIWLSLLRRYPDRVKFQEGLLNAVYLRPDRRLETLREALEVNAAPWINYAIVEEYNK
ncbi:hypothetical protein BJX70DRAFT_404902 [Aspergillus crustosus]